MMGSHVDEMVPPDEMNFVGAGDFRLIGQEFLRHFIQLGSLTPSARVLDVGCGIGRMAIPLTGFLSEEGSYEGFDIVPQGITWCTEKITPHFPRFHFQLADIYSRFYNPAGKHQAKEYEFPYADESFDFVFLTSVFTHMLPDDMERYLAEIARVLKPGSKCLITYFLLNPQALGLMADGKSIIDFKNDLGACRVQDSATPEVAVAYDERFVVGLYRKFQLDIELPLHYGAWCGRSEYLSGHDIVVAAKQSTRPPG